MAKYHINPETGNPNVCKALHKCRFGDSTAHYSSKEEAQEAYEKSMEEVVIKTQKKKFISGQEFEQLLVEKFPLKSQLVLEGKTYTVVAADKPMVEAGGGEGKTDVYIALQDADGHLLEKKISLKKENAEHLQNKLTWERAVEIFGSPRRAKKYLNTIFTELEGKLKERKIDFDTQEGRIEAGSHTLGWRVDFMTSGGRELAHKLDLTEEDLNEIYSGKSLPARKRNLLVNGKIIKDSGVATHFLRSDTSILDESPAEIIQKLETIEDHVAKNPEIYAVLAAVNYRKSKDSAENRSLLASVNRQSGKIDKHEDLSVKSSDIIERDRDKLRSS